MKINLKVYKKLLDLKIINKKLIKIKKLINKIYSLSLALITLNFKKDNK